jgi:trigger factor
MIENNYKKIKEDGCCFTYEVEIKGDEFLKYEERAILRVQKDAEYPGFRKGKVPIDILKKNFANYIIHNLKEIIVIDILDDLYEKEKVFSVITPRILDFNLDEKEKRVSFKIYLEQNPKFEVKNYTDFEVKRNLKKITDEDIDNHIQTIREYHAYLKPVDESVSKKHYLLVDYEVWENGNKVQEFKQELVDMSSPQTIIGFDEAVIGKKKGDSVEFETEFDGKKLKFIVKILDVKEKVVPEIDENFLKELGAKDINDLREQVRKLLEFEELERSEKGIVEQIENHLISNNDFPLPPTVVREEMQEIFEMVKQRANITDPNVTLKDYEDKIKPIAERNLKVTYILNAIANKENIRATDEDYYKELDKVIKTLKSTDEINKAKELFEKRKSYIMAWITENKVLDFIKSKIKIID